jgi:hypothetical protein
MLGKAVYEGICVDIQLAPVLLAAVLDRQLCPFDELASLDPVLYKNLTFLKHYSGDVEDLALTFSFQEEFLGKVSSSPYILTVIPVLIDLHPRIDCRRSGLESEQREQVFFLFLQIKIFFTFPGFPISISWLITEWSSRSVNRRGVSSTDFVP